MYLDFSRWCTRCRGSSDNVAVFRTAPHDSSPFDISNWRVRAYFPFEGFSWCRRETNWEKSPLTFVWGNKLSAMGLLLAQSISFLIMECEYYFYIFFGSAFYTEHRFLNRVVYCVIRLNLHRFTNLKFLSTQLVEWFLSSDRTKLSSSLIYSIRRRGRRR